MLPTLRDLESAEVRRNLLLTAEIARNTCVAFPRGAC
jgi:hypothetical protein